MNELSIKEKITEAVLNQIPAEQRAEFNWALKVWWVNKRKTGGLRLTDLGDFSFRIADIEKFNFPLVTKKQLESDMNWDQFLLELNYKIPCPYYVDAKKPKEPILRVYDSKIAMLISLYGTVQEYLEQTKRKRNK